MRAVRGGMCWGVAEWDSVRRSGCAGGVVGAGCGGVSPEGPAAGWVQAHVP